MKKLLLSCVSLLCLFSTQTRAELAPSFGFSSFSLKSPDYNVRANAGLNIGLSYFYNYGQPLFDIETGLYYMQAGGIQEGYTDTNTLISNTLNLSYLVVPVGVRWKFANLSNASDSYIYTKAGVDSALLMTAKQNISSEGIRIENDIKDQTNKSVVLGYLGVGGTFEIAQDQKMMAELNYMRGTKQVPA